MLALVRAKHSEFLEELHSDDPRTLMTSEGTRWERVSAIVNLADGVSCYRSSEGCKYKWQQLLPDYKRIGDLHKETGTNSEVYFSLTIPARRARNLPPNFDNQVFREMHKWLKLKPTMTPPHSRDLMNPDDSNFQSAPSTTSIEMDEHAFDDVGQYDHDLHAYSSAAAYDYAAEGEDDSSQPSIDVDIHNTQHVFEAPIGSPSDQQPTVPTSIRSRAQAGLRNEDSLNSPLTAGKRRQEDVHGNRRGGAAPHGRSPSSSIVHRGQSASQHIHEPRATPHMEGSSPVHHYRQTTAAVDGNAEDPHIISSSDASMARPRKPATGSTGVRRKTNVAIQSEYNGDGNGHHGRGYETPSPSSRGHVQRFSDLLKQDLHLPYVHLPLSLGCLGFGYFFA
jgi:hypothetical protein